MKDRATLRSDSSVIERLYSRAGRDNRSVLFSSCPAGSPKAINLLESQSTNTLIEKLECVLFGMFSLCALTEAIGFAEQFNDVRMMRETVKQRGGQTFVAKDLHPIGEFEIGGDD